MIAYQVYRCFDKDGALLYVGMSGVALKRMDSHRKNSSWYADMANMSVENFDTKREAEDAERLAIETENPMHNIRFAVDPYACEDKQRLAIKRNMREAFARVDMTQAELAAEMGCGRAAVGHWFTDNQDYLPKTTSIAKFCEICGITPNDLFDEFKQTQQEQAA